ncbi:MAG: Hpt domain-containing protein [Candidatus Omnitrophica bacterium]|nr:Hpt domain-containing protein [Candidatus Omnitrophota bacterium]
MVFEPQNKIEQELVSSFCQEADEMIVTVQELLTSLEGDRQDKELVNEIFRLLHSLKGLAMVLMADPIVQVAHGLEEILELARKGQAVISNPVLTILWQGMKLLDKMLGSFKQKKLAKQYDRDVNKFVSEVQEKLQEVGHGEGQRKRKELSNGTINRRYLYKGADISEQVLVIKRILSSAQEDGAEDLSQGFSPALEILLEKLEGMNDVDGTACLKKMKSDFMALVSDEGVINGFLAGILEEELAGFLTKVQIQERASDMDIPFVVSVDVEDLTTFRIEEKRIEEIIAEVGKIVSLVEALKETEQQKTKSTEEQIRKIEKYNQVLEVFHLSAKKILTKLTAIKNTSLDVLVAKVKKLVRDLAKDSGKKVHVQIDGESVVVSRRIHEVLEKILIHIVRNAVDHGLESPQKRLEEGKPEEGRISIKIETKKKNLSVEVKDNGRGVDLELLRQAAYLKGIMSEEKVQKMDDEEAFKLLFEPGVTTALRVSQVSGRGVGLDVVKKIVEGVEGTIEVSSQKGEGTRFLVQLPLVNKRAKKKSAK